MYFHALKLKVVFGSNFMFLGFPKRLLCFENFFGYMLSKIKFTKLFGTFLSTRINNIKLDMGFYETVGHQKNQIWRSLVSFLSYYFKFKFMR